MTRVLGGTPLYVRARAMVLGNASTTSPQSAFDHGFDAVLARDRGRGTVVTSTHGGGRLPAFANPVTGWAVYRISALTVWR